MISPCVVRAEIQPGLKNPAFSLRNGAEIFNPVKRAFQCNGNGVLTRAERELGHDMLSDCVTFQ